MKGKCHIHRVVALMAWPFNDIILYHKFGIKQKVQTPPPPPPPVDNKSYFSRGQIHPGLVKSLPRSLNRRRMAASMALGDYRYILDSQCKKKCPRYFRRDSRGNRRDLNMCRTGRSAALSRGRKSMPPRRESRKLVVHQRKFT